MINILMESSRASWLYCYNTLGSMDAICPCICGRSFMQDSALSNHQRTCSEVKRRFDDTLSKARALYRPNKRRRLMVPSLSTSQHSTIGDQAVSVLNAPSQMLEREFNNHGLKDHFPSQHGEGSRIQSEVHTYPPSYFQYSYADLCRR
jgi:hypothetical protein